jgi:serine/threonine protein phosphatase PrpC
MRIDVGAGVELRPLDTILVASDGLTDNVHLDETIDIVRMGKLAEGVTSVVNLATSRMTAPKGGQPSKPDDLSLILFRKLDRTRIIER